MRVERNVYQSGTSLNIGTVKGNLHKCRLLFSIALELITGICQNRCDGLYNGYHYGLCSYVLELWLACMEVKYLVTLLRNWGHAASILLDSQTSECYLHCQYKEMALFTQSAAHKPNNFMVVLVCFVQNPLNWLIFWRLSFWKMQSSLLACMGKSLQWI